MNILSLMIDTLNALTLAELSLLVEFANSHKEFYINFTDAFEIYLIFLI